VEVATELPQVIRKSIESIDGSFGQLRASVESDVGANGEYGSSWLVVGDKRVMVYTSENGAATVHADVPMEDISTAAVAPLVGLLAIEVALPDGRIELLRFSNARNKRFARAAKLIDYLANEKELTEDLLIEEELGCPTCGRELREGTKVCPACVKKSRVLRRLFAYAKPYKARCVLVVTLMVCATGLDLAPPIFTKYLVDNILTDAAYYHFLGVAVLALLGTRVLGTVMTILRGRIGGWLGMRLVRDIRADIYGALTRLSLRYFDKKQVGSVMSRVTRDTDAVADFLIDGAFWSSVMVLELVGITVAMFVMNWKLALLILVPAPPIWLMTRVFWRRIRRTFRKVWHCWSAMNAALNDTVSGIRVVKAFTQADREVSKLDRRNDHLFDIRFQGEKIFSSFFPLLFSVSGAAMLLVWYFGGKGVQGGEITLGTLMAFMALLGMFYGRLQNLSRMGDWMSRCLTAGERIFEVLDTEPEAYESPDAKSMPAFKGKVEIKGVHFAYEPGKKVLEDVNIEVEPGEMIGLVGHSGAGKSTLINVICRFYDVEEGAILIDGVDLRDIKLRDLRGQIGIVMQEPFLFPGTVAENIAYGRPESTRQEIVRAAIAANAHEFIVKMSDGYDTEVGERGKLVSGGERQRLSIARALLHNPRILILDEATSSVDLETEKNIQQALERLTASRTTFAIAHRLSTLRNADRLLVLEKGKVAELGTHAELMDKPEGVYAKLAKMHQELSTVRAVSG